MKTCGKCKKEKDHGEFYKDKKAKDGYNYTCKLCRLEMDRARRAKDPDWVERRKKQNHDHHMQNREAIADRKKTWLETEAGKKSHFASSKKFREKYPEKRYAHDAVYRAVQKGELVRPKNCQICNGEGKIEAHHASYDNGKRTSIIWICRACHEAVHKKK